jgi:hypothetical protein
MPRKVKMKQLENVMKYRCLPMIPYRWRLVTELQQLVATDKVSIKEHVEEIKKVF